MWLCAKGFFEAVREFLLGQVLGVFVVALAIFGKDGETIAGGDVPAHHVYAFRLECWNLAFCIFPILRHLLSPMYPASAVCGHSEASKRQSQY